jgi:hypothetical protein
MKGNQVDNEYIATPGGHLEEKGEKIKKRKIHIHIMKHCSEKSSAHVH